MISIAITSFNRSDLTIESFSKVFDHPFVSEIVIVDDCSTEDHWQDLRTLVHRHPVWDKIRLFRNKENLGMSRNKSEAVRRATYEWVILLDSDNVLYPEYLDAIQKEACTKGTNYGLQEEIIYCPVKAEPDYDFSQWSAQFIGRKNAKDFLGVKEFRVLLNTCNYVVNRKRYLEVYEYDETIKESDTIYFNHLWLCSGGSFYVVPEMRYHHRRHSGSGWLNGDHTYNLKKADELQEKIKQL